MMKANAHRRHISKSAQAMAYALLFPRAPHGGDRKSEAAKRNQVSSENLISKELIAKAHTVMKSLAASRMWSSKSCRAKVMNE
jgi:hypothetical protein